ncbi:MAG TPA: hypothetical protein VFU40_09240, partial [Gemmatimonadales bacterium]|nr:hypothetical protein [Gemmatimonadales bacterium]
MRFLLEPGAAQHRRDGFRPLRADQDSTLHPALRSTIQGQPEFAAWVPSSLCFFYVDTVAVAGRTITSRNAHRPQMIAVWTLAASEQGSGARRDVVLGFSAGSSQIVRAAEAVRLRIHEAASKVSRSPESTNEVHEVRIGKTRLVWNGREAGDSSRVEQPVEES